MNGSFSDDVLAIRTDALGNVIWARYYIGTLNNWVYDVVEMEDESLVFLATDSLTWIIRANPDGTISPSCSLESPETPITSNSVFVITSPASSPSGLTVTASVDSTPLQVQSSIFTQQCFDNRECSSPISPYNLVVDSKACGAAPATIDNTPVLAWDDVEGDVGYTWEIWDDPTFTNLLLDSGTTATDVATDTVGTPLPDGLVYWRVKALDPQPECLETWSECVFEVYTGPCTVLAAPTQIDVNGIACGGSPEAIQNEATLNWSDNVNASGYAWEVWTGVGCTGTLLDSGTTAAGQSSVLVSSLPFW